VCVLFALSLVVRAAVLASFARTPFADMLANSQLWLLGLAQLASFGLAIVVGAWITTYLTKSFDLPLKTAGRIGRAAAIGHIFLHQLRHPLDHLRILRRHIRPQREPAGPEVMRVPGVLLCKVTSC